MGIMGDLVLVLAAVALWVVLALEGLDWWRAGR